MKQRETVFNPSPVFCSSVLVSSWPQCDENTTFSNHALYLGLPCCKEDYNSCPSIPSSLIFQRSTKETFWISTQLSSTKLTQNGTKLVQFYPPLW